MSFGVQVASAIYLMMTGASGYELYQMQGRRDLAVMNALMAIAGGIWLAAVLDGRFGP